MKTNKKTNEPTKAGWWPQPNACRVLTMALLWVVVNSMWAVSSIDSIQRLLPRLQGKQKLEAMKSLTTEATYCDNEKYELKCLTDYQAEADRQKDADHGSVARARLLDCYYNYNRYDKIESTLPSVLKYMASKSKWELYYYCWNTLVNSYLYSDRVYTAMHEVRKMYDDARRRNDNMGMGQALHTLGLCYYTLDNRDEAVKFYKRAIPLLSKNNEYYSQLFSVYSDYCDALDNRHDYAQMQKVCQQWEKFLKASKDKMTNVHLAYYLLSVSVVEMERGNTARAWQLLQQLDKLTAHSQLLLRSAYFMNLARFYQSTKQYDLALKANDERLKLNNIPDNEITLINCKEQRIGILMEAGKLAEAALLYQEIIPKKDSLRNRQNMAQLNEFNTLYQVDELAFQKKLTAYQLYAALVGVVILLGLVVFYFIYTHRLRQKNRVLYEAIQQSLKMDEPVSMEEVEAPAVATDTDSAHLYRQLCQYMQEKQPYKDPQLSRDDLAAAIGSNYTYVVNALKENAGGMTVGEFVNGYRLRHVARLLSENQELNINEAGYISGFNSRSTYFRAFRNFFGMSPSEYRMVAMEKTKVATPEDKTPDDE